MRTKKNFKKIIDFQTYLESQLKSPKLRKHYDAYDKQLEIAYQVLSLRKRLGISQTELAKRLGTTQSNIARIETGQQNFTTATLFRIAEVFDRDLKIEFV